MNSLVIEEDNKNSVTILEVADEYDGNFPHESQFDDGQYSPDDV